MNEYVFPSVMYQPGHMAEILELKCHVSDETHGSDTGAQVSCVRRDTWQKYWSSSVMCQTRHMAEILELKCHVSDETHGRDIGTQVSCIRRDMGPTHQIIALKLKSRPHLGADLMQTNQAAH